MLTHGQLELSLSHNGKTWVTDVLGNSLCGEELHNLEDRIINAIQNDPQYRVGETINVLLYFDMDTIPGWLHQYHSHYFNYRFTVYKKQLARS